MDWRWCLPASATSGIKLGRGKDEGIRVNAKARHALHPSPFNPCPFPVLNGNNDMKILVIGSGGREHALAWRLAQGAKVQKVYVAPGNAGTALEDGVENVAITAIPDLIAFAQREDIYLTVVGPEAPLAAGIVDAFRAAGLKIFGPTKAAAQREDIYLTVVGPEAPLAAGIVDAFRA